MTSHLGWFSPVANVTAAMRVIDDGSIFTSTPGELPLQLNQQNLAQLVHEILIETGLSPMRLELEVTESALFKDYQRALDNLRRLKALGVRIVMDDFGTGFSSLSTLQSFPFDKIKVDKSFVENIHRDERATVIVKAVLGLGRSLLVREMADLVLDRARALDPSVILERPEPAVGERADELDYRIDRLRAAGFIPGGDLVAAVDETLAFCRRYPAGAAS